MERRYEFIENFEMKIGCCKVVEIDKSGRSKIGFVPWYHNGKERVMVRGFEKFEMYQSEKYALSKAIYHYYRDLQFREESKGE